METSHFNVPEPMWSDPDWEATLISEPNVFLEPQADIKPVESSDDDYLDSSRSALRRRMFDSFAKSIFDGHHSRKFLPNNSLSRLVTEDSVRLELEDRRSQHDPTVVELVPYICSKATKLFATAVYMKCTRKTLLQVMDQLHDNDFTDEDLPMQLEDGKSKWTALGWSKDQMEDFYDAQWAFLAPFFERLELYYEFSSDCILPFLDLETKDVGVFVFSSITKGRIHEDHISQSLQTSNECVAIKQVSRQSTAEGKSWIAEHRALCDVNALNHPHSVRAIAAFSKGYDGYFIFPWADGGNLRDFWGQNKRLSLDKDSVTESVLQLRGLFGALRSVHSTSSFLHGNLKPENILVFPNEKSSIGHLKISEWGLARKHLEQTKMRHGETTTRHGTRVYQESEPSAVHTANSRLDGVSNDVWALGCVALEHLVWLLYGEKEHERFIAPLVKAGIVGFYKRAGERSMMSPAVVRWMEHMSTQFPPGTGVGDLVEVIRTKMLAIDLPPERGTMHPDEVLKRPYQANAYEIVSSLRTILHRLERDDNYCFSDRPYDGLRGLDDHPATHEASSSGEPN